ncbi:MAG TPA: RNA polymerase sigma factor [Polyangiaceae bacterium]
MDPALLEAFRRGERGALERVYRDHVDDVETFLRSRLARAGRLTAATLADLVQDVFLKAFAEKARASYDGEREYQPYLRALARNLLVDWLRRSLREATEVREIEAVVDAEVDERQQDELFAPELVAATVRYVETLPPELRGVLERRFVEAQPQVTAAQALGISRQNLRTLERKLVDGLRRALRKEVGPELAVPIRQPNRRSLP